MNNELKKFIKWLIHATCIKLEGLPDECYFKEQVRKELTILEEGLQENNFYKLLTIKMSVRRLYRQIASIYVSSAWQAPGFWNSGEALYSCYFQTDLYKYNRVHDNPILIDIKKQFEDELYSKSDNTVTFLTNSGMASLELGAMISNYLRRTGSILVQTGQYYEMKYLTKSLFPEYEDISIQDIYARLLSDEVIRCVVVGYAPYVKDEERFDLDYFLECIQKHKQEEYLVVIIDRTFFSLVDDYTAKINKQVQDKNIIFISGESLNKNHQYGMDIANLGYCRIDSKINRILLNLEFMDKIYSMATMRPEMSSLIELFPFKKNFILERFIQICNNTKFLNDAIRQKGYVTSVVSYSENEDLTYWGNVILVPFELEYVDNEERLKNILKTKNNVIMGTSFGFDITRVEFIGIGKGKLVLRISTGIETMEEISIVRNSILDIIEETSNLKNRKVQL